MFHDSPLSWNTGLTGRGIDVTNMPDTHRLSTDYPMRAFHPAVYLAVVPTILACFLVAMNAHSACSVFQQMFRDLEVAVPSIPALLIGISTNVVLVFLIPILSAGALVICAQRFSALVTLSATLGILSLAFLGHFLIHSIFAVHLLDAISKL